MRGEFIHIWAETWPAIWLPLVEPASDDDPSAPADVFCELYRVFAKAFKTPISVEALAEIIDDPAQSREAFERLVAGDFASERSLVTCLESASEELEGLGGDALANRYFNLLASFIEKFSLRYDVRRPCQLCPTLPGVFAGLVRELRALTTADAHLDALMKDFESAIRDLRSDSSEGKIKTCIQKQMNLLEALGGAYPGVTGNTLGKISDQIGTWPHEKLKLAMKDLYGFSCDYPGIRHGGTASSALRAMDMRDLVAVSILLTGFTPYFGNNLNAIEVFGGGVGHVRAMPSVAAAPVGGATGVAQQRRGFWAWLFDLLFGNRK